MGSVRSARASWFYVRPTSKRWFLKTVQVTMKHDPFDAMWDSTRTLHPSCTHILRWSLKHSVKRTWTRSAVSTNESAWSAISGHGHSVSRVKWLANRVSSHHQIFISEVCVKVGLQLCGPLQKPPFLTPRSHRNSETCNDLPSDRGDFRA